jgi:hypothetical protein
MYGRTIAADNIGPSFESGRLSGTPKDGEDGFVTDRPGRDDDDNGEDCEDERKEEKRGR